MKIYRAILWTLLLATPTRYAHGQSQSVIPVLTNKTLPQATIELIDPEGGGSSGGGCSGSGCYAVGDVVGFRFKYLPVPDGNIRGSAHYLTEFVPPNTSVVGARIVEEKIINPGTSGERREYWTVAPLWPGWVTDGCGRGCNGFGSVPCSAGVPASETGTACSGGTRNLLDGSIAQVFADTGIFYATASSTYRSPTGTFITLTNGTVMSPEPRSVASPKGLLGLDGTDPAYRHVAWDWLQVRAFGTTSAASGNSGRGNTPWKYGSVVAGAETYYKYEASEVSGAVRFNDAVGPWSRVLYPGGQIGSGADASGTGSGGRVNQDPSLGLTGLDVRPAVPLSAEALRFALGDARVGEPGFVEVYLRIDALPLDPLQGADVNCGEMLGSDLARESGGLDNPWLTYLASPQCAYLNLLHDISVDKSVATGADILQYEVRTKNLSLLTDPAGATVTVKYDDSRVNCLSASCPPLLASEINDSATTPLGNPTIDAGCATTSDPDDGAFTCLVWTLPSALGPSDEVQIDLQLDVGGIGQDTIPVYATYDSLPGGLAPSGFTSQAVSTSRSVPVVRASWRTTTVSASSPGSASFTGTISNDGVIGTTLDDLRILLPTGWTISTAPSLVGTAPACSGTLSCQSGCGTNQPTYDAPGELSAGSSCALAFAVTVPGSQATGLYNVDLEVLSMSTSGFGGDTETYFADRTVVARADSYIRLGAMQVPVGQARSNKPVITCPLLFGATTVSGTSESGATVRLYFNLIHQATVTASGATWSAAPSAYAGFGALYAGLEIRASAQATGELESELSDPCFVSSTPACGNGIDDSDPEDTLADFPADPGCDSPDDEDETDPIVECGDGIDNDTDGFIDWPSDPSCFGPDDTTETGPAQCGDGVDNDGDGLIDFASDAGCTSSTDGSETEWDECQDLADNDSDSLIDFGDATCIDCDLGCHSPNDDDEATEVPSPDIKPRLLIVFDTSGSMNWNTCSGNVASFTGGDGSDDGAGNCTGSDVSFATCDCATCGNGTADDSRLFLVKEGIFDAVSNFGEVEWGLMRFHQRAITFLCPDVNASLRSGGWQGGGGAPCPGFDKGDLLVSFSDNNVYDLLEWMDGDTNYPGTPPPGMDIELRGSGTTPIAGTLDSALDYLLAAQTDEGVTGSCRNYRVVLVTDGAESCAGNPVASATALYNAGIDPSFPVYVIGFSTPDAGTIAQLDEIAAAGGTTSYIPADDPAEVAAAFSQIVQDSLLVEYCNYADDDCDGLIDEDYEPTLGSVCNNGELGVCYAEGIWECDLPLATSRTMHCTAAPGVPSTEICNDLDDDCDGLVDEGVPNCPCVPSAELCNCIDDDCDLCGDSSCVDEGSLPGVGTPCDGADADFCAEGTLECSSVSCGLVCNDTTGDDAELCDGGDNDCDGVIDEGFALGGACDGPDADVCPEGTITCDPDDPTMTVCDDLTGDDVEICNYDDDDCDGLIDEDWPDVFTPCVNDPALPEYCQTSGTTLCDSSDPTTTICTAPTVIPGTEICNCLDDDCDGIVDDDLGFPIGESCAAGCGSFVCDPIACTPICMGAASTEVCDGDDNDCDGIVDDPPVPGTGAFCTPEGTDPLTGIAYSDTCDTVTGECAGACEAGTLECVGGEIACVDYEGPQPEVCNGIDDNCDGKTDLPATAVCPEKEQLCLVGECVWPCGVEFCGFGYYCTELEDEEGTSLGEFCVPDPCASVTCGEGLICNSDTGGCEDPCASVTCLKGESCYNGFCLDCHELGCACDEACVNSEEGVGVCVGNPCVTASCDPLCGTLAACVDGECITTCEPACSEGQRCVAGACEADPCFGVECRDGLICNPETAECQKNPCLTFHCTVGEQCVPATGECVPDPCATATCPEDSTCELAFDGAPSCVPIPPTPEVEIAATGAGGCACALGRSKPSPLLAILWVLSAFAVFRGRRAPKSARRNTRRHSGSIGSQ